MAPTRWPPAADAIDGWVLFRGTVVGRDWENTGYMEGRHTLQGAGGFSGHTLRSGSVTRTTCPGSTGSRGWRAPT